MVKSKTCCDNSRTVVCCSAKSNLRFQYWRMKNKNFAWHIRAKNGEIVAQGEGYKRVASVLRLEALLRGGCADMSHERVI